MLAESRRQVPSSPCRLSQTLGLLYEQWAPPARSSGPSSSSGLSRADGQGAHWRSWGDLVAFTDPRDRSETLEIVEDARGGPLRDSGRYAVRALVDGDGRRFDRQNREVQRHPRGQAALERVDPRDALAPEQERHPGARGFVGAGTVEDQLAGSEGLRLDRIDGVGGQPAAPGNGVRRGRDVEGCPEIDDRDVFSGAEAPLQRLG